MTRLASFILGVVLFAPAAAQGPPLTNFQGKLTDSSGIAVPDGSYSVRFRIYSAATGDDQSPSCPAGSCVWEEILSVTTRVGIYSASLGEVTPLTSDIFRGGDRYLGVKVGGDAEMIPRRRIVSVPYAHNADLLDGRNLAESGADIVVKSLSDGTIHPSLIPANLSASPLGTLPGVSVPGAWQPATSYTTPRSVSSDSGKQYKLITGSCTSGATAPTGTGTCSTTTSITCTGANGADTLEECPGAQTCNNLKSDGGCSWQWIGSVHSGTAKMQWFTYNPQTPGANYDGINGDDPEFISMWCYNCTDGLMTQIDATEYSVGWQNTWGWSADGGAKRNFEWFLSHRTPSGAIFWHPLVSNIHGVNTEAPVADFQWLTRPNETGFAVQSGQFAVLTTPTSGAAFQVAGNGIIEAGGAANRLTFEGPTRGDSQSLSFVPPTPSHGVRNIFLPNIASDARAVVSLLSSTSGPAAWAANGVSCTTACTNIGQNNCANATCISGVGSTCTAVGLSVACSVTDQRRLCGCY